MTIDSRFYYKDEKPNPQKIIAKCIDILTKEGYQDVREAQTVPELLANNYGIVLFTDGSALRALFVCFNIGDKNEFVSGNKVSFSLGRWDKEREIFTKLMDSLNSGPYYVNWDDTTDDWLRITKLKG